MRNRFCLILLVMATCVTVAMAGEGDVERLLRECSGLTFSEATALLEKNGFPGECTWFDDDGTLPSMARHRVDGTTCIVLFADGEADREGTAPGGDGAVVDRCELVSFAQRCSRQFPEDECRMLRLVHEAPVPWGGDFNPSRLLAAASALQALGEEEAVRLLRLYCESFTADEQRMHGIDSARCLSILRLLYLPRDAGDALPPIDYGLPFPFGRYFEYELLLKRISREFPLFPLVLVGDVPLTLAEGYLVAGCCPPTVEEYLAACRNLCVFRKTPLPPSADVRAACGKLLRSEEWHRAFGDNERLQEELVALLERQARNAQGPNRGCPSAAPSKTSGTS